MAIKQTVGNDKMVNVSSIFGPPVGCRSVIDVGDVMGSINIHLLLYFEVSNSGLPSPRN